MSGFISKFYSGYINTPAHSLKELRRTNEQTKITEEKEQQLMSRLTEEQQRLFLEYIDSKVLVQYINEEDSFTLGFRLGAKFAQDTFKIKEDAFYDISKFEY